MSALTVNLMGSVVMDEATIQARAQDIIASVWPAWKRERALRLGDVAALNAFMDEISAEVDLARENSALLAGALAVEAATARLALPVYDGPQTIEGERGPEVHPDMARDVSERGEATTLIATAPAQVVALVTARIPPAPEPETEPEPVP